MGREEQQEEREVLDSIFPDEITDVSETEYRISITLDDPQDDTEGDGPPTIILRVSYPEAYPDVAPDLDLGMPPNAPRYKELDIQEDKARLLESLQPSIEENLGMAMIFALVSTLKDSAELLISERRQAVQAVKEVEAAKAEEAENRKFQGRVVTRESFLEWRAKFRAEKAEQERRLQEEKEIEDKKRRAGREEPRLTGRELWERGLAGKVDEEDDGGQDALDKVKDLKIDQ